MPAGDALDNPRIVSIEELIASLPAGRSHIIGDAANLIEFGVAADRIRPLFTQIDAPDIALGGAARRARRTRA